MRVSRDSSVGKTTHTRTGQTEDRMTLGGEIYRTVQTGLGAHPALFAGIKRPGRSVDHPPPFSAEVKARLELHLCSPSGP
jgi:hypothetical protein